MPEEGLLNEDNRETASNDDDSVSSPHTEESSDTIIDEEENPIDDKMTYVAVKGTFFTPKAENAGAFCIIYKGDNGKVIFGELWAIRSNTKPNLDVSEKWDHFIISMDKIGAYDKDSSAKFSALVLQSLNNNIKEYLYKNISEKEFAQAEIRKGLENVLRYIVDVEVEAELVGEERAEKGGLLRDKGKEVSSDEVKSEDEINSLMGLINTNEFPIVCMPVIDPVKGCAVSKIKVGDVVYAKIPETNDVSKKVMDFVRLQHMEPAFPVSVVLPLKSGKSAVVLKINEEISGVMNLSSELMLKTDALPVAEVKTFSVLKKRLLNTQNLLLGGMIVFFILLLYLITKFISI